MSYAMTSYGRSKLFRAPMARYGAMDARAIPALKRGATVALSGAAAVALMDYVRGYYGDASVEVGTGLRRVDGELLVGLGCLGLAVFGTGKAAKASEFLEGAGTGLLASVAGRMARRMGEEAAKKSG
jgi:hypothetical protein